MLKKDKISITDGFLLSQALMWHHVALDQLGPLVTEQANERPMKHGSTRTTAEHFQRRSLDAGNTTPDNQKAALFLSATTATSLTQRGWPSAAPGCESQQSRDLSAHSQVSDSPRIPWERNHIQKGEWPVSCLKT